MRREFLLSLWCLMLLVMMSGCHYFAFHYHHHSHYRPHYRGHGYHHHHHHFHHW